MRITIRTPHNCTTLETCYGAAAELALCSLPVSELQLYQSSVKLLIESEREKGVIADSSKALEATELRRRYDMTRPAASCPFVFQ